MVELKKEDVDTEGVEGCNDGSKDQAPLIISKLSSDFAGNVLGH